MENVKLVILSNGMRLICEVEETDNSLFLIDPFLIEEQLFESNDESSFMTSYLLISLLAYAKSNRIQVNPNHIFAITEAGDVIIEQYKAEKDSISNQIESKKPRKKEGNLIEFRGKKN